MISFRRVVAWAKREYDYVRRCPALRTARVGPRGNCEYCWVGVAVKGATASGPQTTPVTNSSSKTPPAMDNKDKMCNRSKKDVGHGRGNAKN